MSGVKVVSREEWLEARKALLEREKAWTREKDALSAARREMPAVKIEKEYVFRGSDGPVALTDLFEGRGQLIVHHFMFADGWTDGCKICSMFADSWDGSTAHLSGRDVTMVAVSTAPLEVLESFKQRMGWTFNWVSCDGNDFNRDYHASFSEEDKAKGKVTYNYRESNYPGPESPAVSVFQKGGDGNVYHTYSAYARGLDQIMGTYQLLDLVPKGRDEEGLPFSLAWVKLHDQY